LNKNKRLSFGDLKKQYDQTDNKTFKNQRNKTQNQSSNKKLLDFKKHNPIKSKSIS
jgi:hypothetical protein